MLQTSPDLRAPRSRQHGLVTAAHVLWTHKWSTIALLAVAIAGFWILARWIVGTEVVVYPVIRADLVKTVVASGHVETPFRVNIGSQITGTVEEVLVDEGQTVRRGQPLIALEPSELKAAAVEAESAVAQADARMRQMRELALPAAREALK